MPDLPSSVYVPIAAVLVGAIIALWRELMWKRRYEGAKRRFASRSVDMAMTPYNDSDPPPRSLPAPSWTDESGVSFAELEQQELERRRAASRRSQHEVTPVEVPKRRNERR